MGKGWNKAFKRMQAQGNREVIEFERSWDVTLKRLADEWNALPGKLKLRNEEGRG